MLALQHAAIHWEYPIAVPLCICMNLLIACNYS